MTHDVNGEFEAIVAGLANELVAGKLANLMDLASELGPWPVDEAPMMVRLLWK